MPWSPQRLQGDHLRQRERSPTVARAPSSVEDLRLMNTFFVDDRSCANYLAPQEIKDVALFLPWRDTKAFKATEVNKTKQDQLVHPSLARAVRLFGIV